MYRTSKNFDIKLRLSEINRRSVELSTTSSKLANLAAQLDHLRKANGRIGVFATRATRSDQRGDGDFLSYKH